MTERYTVTMPDGGRYGPADLATLREWAAAGRIGRETALVVESTGASARADSVAGLFDGIPAPPVASPPARNNRATMWIVLGVLGLAGSCVVLILAAILFPVFAQARLAARRTQGLSGMKRLGVGVLLYTADADDAFPPEMASAKAMEPWIGPYVKDPALFRSKNPAGGEILGDARLGGKKETALAEAGRTITLHDGKPWADGKAPVGLADGSARRVPFVDIAELMKPDPFAPAWHR